MIRGDRGSAGVRGVGEGLGLAGSLRLDCWAAGEASVG